MFSAIIVLLENFTVLQTVVPQENLHTVLECRKKDLTGVITFYYTKEKVFVFCGRVPVTYKGQSLWVTSSLLAHAENIPVH